jgi:hypothetical protein
MKGPGLAILAAIGSAALMLAMANAAREASVERLLEHGYPTLSEDDAPLRIRRIEWQGKPPVLAGSWGNVEMAGGWSAVVAPEPIFVAFDTECGIDCVRALKGRAETSCYAPYRDVIGTMYSSPCVMHLWSLADDTPYCYFSLERKIVLPDIIPGLKNELPTEIPFQCPTGLAWLPN